MRLFLNNDEKTSIVNSTMTNIFCPKLPTLNYSSFSITIFSISLSFIHLIQVNYYLSIVSVAQSYNCYKMKINSNNYNTKRVFIQVILHTF